MPEKNNKDESRSREDQDSTALALPGFGFPSIFNEIMRPFDEFMQPFFSGSMQSTWSELRAREPTVDLQDRGDHYVVTAELPGLEKREVEVRVTEDALELKAEKKSSPEKKESGAFQSTYSYFHRYYKLPEHVLSEKVNGTMKNGVLELQLPKREPTAIKANPRRVDLK